MSDDVNHAITIKDSVRYMAPLNYDRNLLSTKQNQSI